MKKKNVLVFLFIVLMSSSAISEDNKDVAPKVVFGLEEINQIAEKYDINIIDWQHFNYHLNFDSKKITSRVAFVGWLQSNLHDWILSESKSKAIFYLLPKGVDSDALSINPIKDKNDLLFKDALQAYGLAKTTPISDIFKLKETEKLTDLAEKEKKNNLFVIRNAESLTSKEEYSFSVNYNTKFNKFMPFEFNGHPVIERKLEGFVCYDTVLKYIKNQAKEFNVKRSGSWTFFHLKNQEDSFMGLHETDMGLDIVTNVIVNSKSVIKYCIKGRDSGFNATTIIPMKSEQFLLMDNVSFMKR